VELDLTSINTQYGKNLYLGVLNLWSNSNKFEDSHHQIVYDINRFIFYKNKKIINSPYSDITFWTKKTYAHFQRYILSLDIKHNLLKKTKDITHVYENDNVKILTPNTYEAACKFGYDTKWCIASKSTYYYWWYFTQNEKVYYILPKKMTKSI